MTIIVGGGILGLLCAAYARELGDELTVLELDRVGRRSSWAGGGILSPLYPWRYPDAVNALSFWSQREYLALSERLRVSSGVDPEWTSSGMIAFGCQDLEAAKTWAGTNHARLEPVSQIQVCDLEPAASRELGPGIWMPDVAQVRNPRLLSALRTDLLKSGVTIREATEVIGFGVRRGRLASVKTAQGEYATERCIVAAGAWTSALMKTVGLDLPIRPVRGQMLLFAPHPGLVKRILLKDGSYVIPRRDGRILVGSTVEDAGFDPSTTAEARTKLLAAAADLVPALADGPIERHWAGLRPGSPDGVPYIDEHPEIRGLYVNSGHYRNGIVMAPASARLVTDIMWREKPPIDPEPYRLRYS